MMWDVCGFLSFVWMTSWPIRLMFGAVIPSIPAATVVQEEPSEIATAYIGLWDD